MLRAVLQACHISVVSVTLMTTVIRSRRISVLTLSTRLSSMQATVGVTSLQFLHLPQGTDAGRVGLPADAAARRTVFGRGKHLVGNGGKAKSLCRAHRPLHGNGSRRRFGWHRVLLVEFCFFRLYHKRNGMSREVQIKRTLKKYVLASAFLAEKARTPRRKSLWWCFFVEISLQKGSLREGLLASLGANSLCEYCSVPSSRRSRVRENA